MDVLASENGQESITANPSPVGTTRLPARGHFWNLGLRLRGHLHSPISSSISVTYISTPFTSSAAPLTGSAEPPQHLLERRAMADAARADRHAGQGIAGKGHRPVTQEAACERAEAVAALAADVVVAFVARHHTRDPPRDRGHRSRSRTQFVSLEVKVGRTCQGAAISRFTDPARRDARYVRVRIFRSGLFS